jgi:hypothetical protein
MLIQRNQLKNVIEQIKDEPTIVVDLETNTLNLWEDSARVIGMALYLPNAKQEYYIPFAHGQGKLTDKTENDVAGLKWSNADKRAFEGQRIYENHFMADVQSANIPGALNKLLDIVFSSSEIITKFLDGT